MSDAEIAASTLRRLRLLMDVHERHERRHDLRAGVIAAAVLNAAGGKGDGVGYSPADFFPHLAPPIEPKTDDEMEAEARAFAARWNRSNAHGS